MRLLCADKGLETLEVQSEKDILDVRQFLEK